MSKLKPIGTNPESLMKMLGNKDGMIRQKARKSLVAMGKPVVPPLIEALQSSKKVQVRWEAAKALGAIGDTRSISPFVEALEDRDSDVAWLAAEALMEFKKAAWRPLLKALIERAAESPALCRGVHHVMRHQKDTRFNDLLAALAKSLESSTGSESMEVAAYDILKRMKAIS